MKKNTILSSAILVSFLVSIMVVSPVSAATVGLVAEWDLDEGIGSVAYDSSGNANDGVLSGGKFGNSLEFDGINDNIFVDGAAMDLSGMSQLTLEAWVYVHSYPSTFAAVVTKWYQSTTFDTYGIWISSGQKLVGGLGPQIEYGLYGTSDVTLDTWHYVALVYDSSAGTAELYLDGVLEATRTGLSGDLNSADNPLYIGCDYYGIAATSYEWRFFDGRIDEVRISNTPHAISGLPASAFSRESDTVALWHFDESTGTSTTSDSDIPHTGSLNGATWAGPTWTTGVPGDDSLTFDGEDDYVSVPIFPLTDEVTIDAWVYFIAGSPEGDYGGIICNLNGRHNRNRLLLMGATMVLWQVYIGGATYNHFFTLPSDQRNAWHHYVLVYDGANVRLFWDGEQVGEDQPQTGSLDSGTTPPTIGLGSTIEGYYYLKGMIDEVRIWNVALEAEIDVNPDTLNLKSNGEWITCYIELSDGFDVNDIDVDSIELTVDGEEFVIAPEAPTEIGDYDSDGVPDLMVKFDRCSVIGKVGTIDFENTDGKFYDLPTTITGTADGIPFGGTDTIRVRK